MARRSRPRSPSVQPTSLTPKQLRSLAERLAEEVMEGEIREDVAMFDPDQTFPISSIKGVRERIFIVHGHDDGIKESVARFVEQLGFEPVILHERPNMGRTIITKFREESKDVAFAIVLMTPDDVGRAASASDMKHRARQNVVFELGFFIGALGPERVAAMVNGDIERPSDFDGVLYIPLGKADWRTKLGAEIKAAGFRFDWNKVLL